MCISILIPFYNTKFEYFKECLLSIENQNFNKTFEIIIINDGSESNISNKIKNFISTLNKTYILFDLDQNYGIAYALNYGLNKCKYDLVARMDSDDIMKHDRLTKQYDYMIKHPQCTVLGGQCEMMNENTKKINYTTNHPNIITKEYLKQYKKIWFANHPTVMYRKKIILDIGPYDIHLKGHSEDTYLWLQLIKKGYQLHNLSDVILIYRDCPGSLSHNFKYDVKKDILNWIYSL